MGWFRKRVPGAGMPASAPASATTGGDAPAAPGKRRWRLLPRVFLGLLVFVLAAILALCAALGWAFNTESGRAWLMQTLNAALAAAPAQTASPGQTDGAGGQAGLSFRLTRLDGSLPFDMTFGLEAADAHGVWLEAPENRLVWNWRALPGSIRLEEVSAARVRLLRLPDLPPAAPEPPTPPLTVADVRGLLARGASLLGKPPFWLPEISARLTITDARLPASLLGDAGKATQNVHPENGAAPTAQAAEPDSAGRQLRADASADLTLTSSDPAASDTAGAATARLALKAALAAADGKPLPLPSLTLDAADLTAVATVRGTAGHEEPGLAASLTVEGALAAPVLEMAGLPRDLLGGRATLSLGLDARSDVSPGASGPAVALSLRGPNLAAGRVQLQGEGQWNSGPDWDAARDADATPLVAALDGPLALRLSAALSPGAAEDAAQAGANAGDDLLAMFRAPLRLTFTANGTLPRPDARLGLECAAVERDGHTLNTLALTLAGRELVLPFVASGDEPGGETRLRLELSGLLDGRELGCSGDLFYTQTAASASTPDPDDGHAAQPPAAHGLRAGVRDLRLNGAGLRGSGAVSVFLPPGGLPELEGQLTLGVADWAALSAFVPGSSLDGTAELELTLTPPAVPSAAARTHSGNAQPIPGATPAANPEANPAPAPAAKTPAASGQQAALALRVPRFVLRDARGNDTVAVRDLTLEAKLADLFGAPGLNARLALGNAAASGMHLGARLTADGPLAGPLALKLESDGSLVCRLDAVWEPGSVLLRVLDARAFPPASLTGSAPAARPAACGLRLTRPARLRYGAQGLGVDTLDLALSPSGHLEARGGLAPDRLDLALKLAGFSLRDWQALVPALPDGSVALTATLTGSPARPQGRFRLDVRQLHIPASPLAPLGFALTGALAPAGAGGVLSTRLEMDPASVRALGGTTARVSARLPLLFGPDGIPRPDMKGALSAQVRWDGAIGPLWNLVPLADKRLNGRLAISLDATGSLDAPRLRGGVRVDKGRFEDLTLGVLLTDIGLRLNLEDTPGRSLPAGPHGLPGGMRLALNASDGRGGTVTVTGTGALDGSALDIRAAIDHLRPLRRRDLHIALSGQATVRGSATAPDVAGEIVINQGEFLLNNLSLTGSVTTLPISEAEAVPVAAKSPDGRNGGRSA